MTAPEAPADPVGFRALMSRWATEVAVVTAHDATGDAGLTVNALSSVSLAPPSLLVSLSLDADTTPVVQRTGTFAASFLAADQRSLSERFARTVPALEKFRGLRLGRGVTGAALLEGAVGTVECRVAGWIPRYDHVLIVGEVVGQAVGRDAPPLVYFRSGYAEAEEDGRLRLPTGRR